MEDRQYVVRKLRAAEIHPTAEVLGQAFADNPCYAFMHPRVADRGAALRAYFRRNLEWHLRLCLTWIAHTPGGEVVGTITLEPPHGVPSSLWPALRHWAIPTWREHGLETLRRLLIADGEFKAQYHSMCNKGAYWHVHAVAVAPAHQGRGIGRAMLGTVLAALHELTRAQPAPVLLSTQRERNLAFYRSHDFELSHETTMGRARGERGYTSWFMRHRNLSS